MTRLKVAHLVDDTTAGGVMRLLDFICTNPDMARHADHQMHVVRRGAIGLRRIPADVIVSHLSISWRALPALVALRATHARQKIIHVEHSYTRQFTALNVPKVDRFMTLLRVAYALFDHVVAVSRDQAGWMAQRNLVIHGELSVIPPMVDLSRFAELADPVRPPRRIGAIGRLDRQKGFDLLIPAFRALPDRDLRLIFYGDGPERAALQELAGQDPRIRFVGHLSDPALAMANVDAVAMPSRWEAYGLVAREARAAGRPVLVAPHDGLRDQVADGAVPVMPYTENGWTAALSRLVAGQVSPAPRPDIARQTRDFVTAWTTLLDRLTGADQAAEQPRAQVA